MDERRIDAFDSLLDAMGYDSASWTCTWVPLCGDCGGAEIHIAVDDVAECRCAGGEHD